MNAVATPKPNETLARLIYESGYRKGYVAEMAGIPASSLSVLLSGKRAMSPNYAVKLARALGVSVETLLPQEGE